MLAAGCIITSVSALPSQKLRIGAANGGRNYNVQDNIESKVRWPLCDVDQMAWESSGGCSV